MAANPILTPVEATDVSGQIHLGDNLQLLKTLPDRSCRLIYIDPPFNTQKVQKRDRISVTRDENGERGGFGGARYSVVRSESPTYVVFPY